MEQMLQNQSRRQGRIRRCIATILVCYGFVIFAYAAQSHPSIFIVSDSSDLFTSINDLQPTKASGHQAKLWTSMQADVAEDLKHPFIDPTTDFAGRDPIHLKHHNVSYDMAKGVCERLGRLALMFLVTNEEHFKEAVVRQIEVLLDTSYWPMWCDDAHVNQPPHVDIRTFRISMWIALCYNWLFESLNDEERRTIIEGLDRRAIKPFWEKLAQRPSWYVHRHNWFTNMFGGIGITAMALGDDHPQTAMILDTVVPEMIDFNDVFGAMGEFNEPPGYAGAVRFSVEFAEAYRYYTHNSSNLLAQKPFPDICYWMMYHTIPPGRMIPFGDTNPDQPVSTPAIVAAVANANQDEILQGYYLSYAKEIGTPLELLWYNPMLPSKAANGTLPLGKAYQEYGADLISRTSWDPAVTTCVVYGKAGRETNHDDNDVGQLCIDGYGEPLIIDCGKPKPIYPKDYFASTQYNYYSRSSKGHNVLVIGDQEMRSEPNETARGHILRSHFDDSVGASWKIDLTPVYPGAERVTRQVIHLFPGIVAVLDEVKLPKSDSIDLRWHCSALPRGVHEGAFTVSAKSAHVSARVVPLDNSTLYVSIGNQSYEPPYDRTRQGDPLEQDYEPFVKISTYGNQATILSLFVVTKKLDPALAWTLEENSYQLIKDDIKYTVRVVEDQLVVNSSEGHELR